MKIWWPWRRKTFLTAAALMGLMVLNALAQRSPKQRAPEFHWDRDTFTELDYKHTLAKVKDLDPAEKAALVKAISAQIRPFKADLEIASERELWNIASQSRFSMIDLNGDGAPEVIVQPVGMKTGCGATGNCPFWVFVRAPKGYQSIMDTRGSDGIGGIELHRIELTPSNNFHDITLATHDSVSEKTILIYRFQNGKYRPVRCYSLNRVSTSGGKWHELKNPAVTRCKAR